MLVVLTGGARSGKSRVAMKIALSNTTNPSLIATAEAGEDDSKKTSSTIYIYKMFLAKEKALYLNLNMMKWQN